MAVRGRTPLVVAAGASSLALLAVIVQVPGLSQFFGCQPLLPHQWGIALAAATAATAVEILSRAWNSPSVHQNPTRSSPA
jgi:cation-transporting ATPase I